MNIRLTSWWFLCGIVQLMALPAFAQSQTCPVNINFSEGDLSSWSAETGLRSGASKDYPTPNTGITTLPEYNLPGTGIEVITTASTDPYGGFATIPTVNGYAYKYAVKLGSTATSWDLGTNSTNPGGFRRSITYTINVPAGPAGTPYTITYAYAMVLENGTHNDNQQPMFQATLSTNDGVIDCASPKYYLPTHNNANSGPGGGLIGATLDTAEALAEGFTLSPVAFLSHAGARGNNGTLLNDVWTKGWTEVTFDLSPYRGQQVTLSFEADNCAPGAHFAYAYVALRNSCAGLSISGNATACTNSSLTYSVPALANATYQWTVPDGWTITSGAGTHEIKVTAGTASGPIIVHEQNSCADLRDTLLVTTTPPTLGGRLTGATRVCAGSNSIPMTLQGERGDILGWISSTDGGGTWEPISNTSDNYTAKDLASTTTYAVLVQNGNTCAVDTSSIAIAAVDAKSVGGFLDPAAISVCADQSAGGLISLKENTGTVLNWQRSADSIHWSNFSPAYQDSSYAVNAITATTFYRAVVQNGVCTADTSETASTHFIDSPFPDAEISPATASICYGDSIQLTAEINKGTDYSWSPVNTLSGMNSGTLGQVPATLTTIAKPMDTTDYVFTLENAGCPNKLTDTFHVAVSPPIAVFAGNDTSIVAGQPLQLNAIVNDPNADFFTWTPATGLNFTDIPDPIATLSTTVDTITYFIKATDEAGCYGEDSIRVAVFKTSTDIFVPTAFTPNGDGMNDLIYPICVGIEKLNFFRVYDRWGHLVFNTHQIGEGWNGRIKGNLAPTGSFVYMVEGVDFTGKTIFKKGSFILIR